MELVTTHAANNPIVLQNDEISLVDPNGSRLTIEQIIKAAIESTLRVTDGNKYKAAKLLKMSRSTLYRHLSAASPK